MTPKQRRLLLLGLLAASTALVALGDKADKPQPVGAVVAASERAAAGPRGRTSANATSDGQGDMIREIQPRAAAAEVGKAFATRDWTPPPPPPPPKATEAPAAAPTAPPLSFTFLGKEWQEGHWLVFLGQNNKTYIVKEGDPIDSDYRVDAIHPPRMTLTYLPLEQQQTLTIGDSP